MENEYYYPKIEEICVGYECEINWSLGYDVYYAPTIVKLKDEEGIYSDQLQEIIWGMDDGYMEVRVPFLNEEQILKEGWERVQKGWNIAEKKVVFEKKGYNYWLLLNTNYEIPYINIIVIDSAKEYKFFQLHNYSLTLPCPTINEFRKIFKLLNLNEQHADNRK